MTNIYGYLLFALVTSITPGPNNLLLLDYGKTHGFKGSLGIMAGIFFGFFVLLYLAGYGIGQILKTNEYVALSFKILSSIWLLYLAYLMTKIKFSNERTINKNIGFVQLFLMQFLNPKAWLMAINGAAVFMPTFTNVHLNVFVFAVIFNLVGIPCMIAWIMIGDIISRFWNSPMSNKIIGYSLAFLMVLCVASIWL